MLNRLIESLQPDEEPSDYRVLAEFGSAVEAVSCALALQQELSSRTQKEDLQVRIGIHLGDVVDKAGDLFGTAVNIAARLEGLAQPGSIVVSSAVRDAIAGKLAVLSTDLGTQNLKNIDEPLRAFALMPNGAASPSVFRSGEALPLPSKPSIAVLPFENLSGDREQEYFADGIVEEIITSLSRMHWLFVIARNSSFAYKGRAVDMKQVGRELGVRYLLEGSVRKSGGRIRIIGQLINAATGTHLWADRFDGSLEDIFDLQDQVAASVVGALAPKLEQVEIERGSKISQPRTSTPTTTICAALQLQTALQRRRMKRRSECFTAPWNVIPILYGLTRELHTATRSEKWPDGW